MKIDLGKNELIHFVGIGGIGMSGLASLFDGGGHKAASGFSSPLSEEEIIDKIKNAIKT